MSDQTQGCPACGRGKNVDSSEPASSIPYRLLQGENCRIHQVDGGRNSPMNEGFPCPAVVLLNARRRPAEAPPPHDGADPCLSEVKAPCLTAAGEDPSQKAPPPIALARNPESDQAGGVARRNKGRLQALPAHLADELRLRPPPQPDAVRRLFSDVIGVVERKALEDSLRQRHALLHCLDDAGIVGVAFLRPGGGLDDVNAAFQRLFHLNCDDIRGGTVDWLDLVVPEMRDSARQILREAGLRAIMEPQEILCLGRDGVPSPFLFAATRLPGEGALLLFVLPVADREPLERLLHLSYCHLQDLAMHGDMSMELERRRIAREIHDEQGSLLTALKLDLSLLRRELSDIPPVVGDRLDSMQQLLDEMVRAMRQVASQLRPAALNLGFLPSLEWLVQDFEKRTGIACRLDAAGTPALDEVRATALFRIAQESLTNVTRHAAASVVDICLAPRGDRLCLQIRDDGYGFDPVNAGNLTLGLKGMYERLELLGGCLNIDSAPGRGTLLQIDIPFSSPAREGISLDKGHEDRPPAQAVV